MAVLCSDRPQIQQRLGTSRWGLRMRCSRARQVALWKVYMRVSSVVAAIIPFLSIHIYRSSQSNIHKHRRHGTRGSWLHHGRQSFEPQSANGERFQSWYVATERSYHTRTDLYQIMATTTTSAMMSIARQHFVGYVQPAASRFLPSCSRSSISLLKTRLLAS
jgi:hypothetical protein